MDVFLHIGWHKTGTTAIQKFLFRNREELRKRGINYPAAGLHRVAHNLPAWGLQMPLRARILEEVGCSSTPESIVDKMLQETSRAGVKSMLVSSEEFSPIHRFSLERLAGMFEGHRVVVIAYVRRQDEHIESTYNQMVKFARSRLAKRFPIFVEEQIRNERLNYHRHFRQWAAAFGRENLRIRAYGRSRFRTGDVRRDFCDVLGLDDKGLAFDSVDSNESLDFDSVCFLSRFNAVPLTGPQHQVVLEALKEFAATNPKLSYGLLDPQERARIVSRYRDSNREFAREFLGTEEAFDPVDAAQSAARDGFDDASFMRMLSVVMGKLLPDNQGENGPRRKKQKKAKYRSTGTPPVDD